MFLNWSNPDFFTPSATICSYTLVYQAVFVDVG